jgi:hypothetical protein
MVTILLNTLINNITKLIKLSLLNITFNIFYYAKIIVMLVVIKIFIN